MTTYAKKMHNGGQRGTVAMNAVVQVGGGLGFVVRDAGRVRRGWRDARVVITAAHCVPTSRSYDTVYGYACGHEYSYHALLGPRGQKPTVWAECLFADLIADVAVLGIPDNYELPEQQRAYAEQVSRANRLAGANLAASALRSGRERALQPL